MDILGDIKSKRFVCFFSGDHIYVTGGYGGVPCRRMQKCEYYIVDEDRWKPFAVLNQSRSHHATLSMGDMLCTIGGEWTALLSFYFHLRALALICL